jgi:hypothetical protein
MAEHYRKLIARGSPFTGRPVSAFPEVNTHVACDVDFAIDPEVHLLDV